MSKKKNKRRWTTWLTFGLRLLAALYIIIDPLWGLIATFFADWLDSQLLLHWAGFERSEYTYWDKNVDWLYYLSMLIVGYWFGYGIPLSILLIFRLIGHLYYINSRNEDYLIYFPDFYTFTFIWLVLGQYLGFTNGLTDLQFWGGLIVLWIIKVFHEYVLHKLWISFLKENGYPNFLNKFGYDRVKV